VSDSFTVVDCDTRRAWSFSDEPTAVRYAAGRHAASAAVIEVVDGAGRQRLLLPPSAPHARPSKRDT
jgi:hypothetical protein